MKIKNSKNLIENISCNLVSIIILLNAFQMVFSWNFNIKFSMRIEFAVIIILFMINKFKIVNIKNILITAIMAMFFAINTIINDSSTLKLYINEFMLHALPIMLIFLIKIDLKRFTKIFFKYNIINIILYLSVIVINANVLVKDYMTFGFHAIFSLSYVIIYSYYNRYWKILASSILVLPFILLNGNRGTILISTVAIILMVLINKKNIKNKLFLVLFIIIFSININTIIKFALDFAIENMGMEMSYSIRNLYQMLESQNLESIIGGRYNIYEQAIQEFQQSPILGIGIATFQDKYNYFPHNIIIDVYLTFGIITGTVYFIYIIVIGSNLYKISKNNIQVRILFIFMLANISKLMLSKTFIYDPTIWLYISMGNYIIKMYRRDTYEDNSIYTNV